MKFQKYITLPGPQCFRKYFSSCQKLALRPNHPASWTPWNLVRAPYSSTSLPTTNQNTYIRTSILRSLFWEVTLVQMSCNIMLENSTAEISICGICNGFEEDWSSEPIVLVPVPVPVQPNVMTPSWVTYIAEIGYWFLFWFGLQTNWLHCTI